MFKYKQYYSLSRIFWQLPFGFRFAGLLKRPLLIVVISAPAVHASSDPNL